MYDIMANTEVIKALRISNINVDEVVLGTKKTTKTIPIRYQNKPFVFQTPFMEVLGGLGKTRYPNLYQLDTLFKGDTRSKIDQMFHFIENLEDRVVKLLSSNGNLWFQHQEIVIKTLIRELDASKENYFIKWPIGLKDNIFVGEDKKPFDPSELKSGDCVKLIVGISDLWMGGNQCGLAVNVQKILVKKFEEKISSEYIFDDSDNEDNDSENNIISLLATEQKTRPTIEKNSNSLLNGGISLQGVSGESRKVNPLSTTTNVPVKIVENVVNRNQAKNSKVEDQDYNKHRKSKNSETQHNKTSKNSSIQKKSKKILDEFDLSIEELSESNDSDNAEINEDDLDFE